jgi:DNA repair exonuclease SbcCD nuclease subunit
MNKALIFSDPHLGIPSKLDNCIWAMMIMRQYAHDHHITNVYCLGDLFHDRVSINIETLVKAYDFFSETQEKWGQKWTTFPGNHDMFLKNSWDINSVRPLGKVLTAIDEPSVIDFVDFKFFILPFIYNEDEYLVHLMEINNRAEPQDILLTHIGVRGAELNRCFLLQHWSKVHFDDVKMSSIFTGHFHCQQQVGDRIWYPGSPISFRFDDGLVDHGFLVVNFNPRKVEFIDIYDACPAELLSQAPPKHLTNMSDTEEGTIIKNAKGNNIKIILSREYTPNELTTIRQNLIESGAKSVVFARPKEQIETERKMSNVKVDLRNHKSALHTWLSVDKPTEYDIKLLEKLNESISERAEEILIEKGLEDDE